MCADDFAQLHMWLYFIYFTVQERSERLELAQQQKLILTKRYQINALFEVWDNDRSGYLELDELQLVLGHWKDFSSEQAQEHGEKTPVRSCYTL